MDRSQNTLVRLSRQARAGNLPSSLSTDSRFPRTQLLDADEDFSTLRRFSASYDVRRTR